MPGPTLPILAYVGLAFGLHINNAAAIGAMGVLPRSAFERLSPLRTVQAGECWEWDGPDGPGYYPCGDGGGGPIVGPASAALTVAAPVASLLRPAPRRSRPALLVCMRATGPLEYMSVRLPPRVLRTAR